MLVLIIIVYAMLALYEFVPLYKEREVNTLVINGVLFLISFITAVLICLGVSIPSPADPIKKVITSIFGK